MRPACRGVSLSHRHSGIGIALGYTVMNVDVLDILVGLLVDGLVHLVLLYASKTRRQRVAANRFAPPYGACLHSLGPPACACLMEWWGRNERPFFSRQIFVVLHFLFFWGIASCLNLQDNMLTGLFSSTIRTVIGSQYVREKWSIALLF